VHTFFAHLLGRGFGLRVRLLSQPSKSDGSGSTWFRSERVHTAMGWGDAIAFVPADRVENSERKGAVGLDGHRRLVALGMSALACMLGG